MTLFRSLLAGAVLLAAAPAFAGECPAGKQGVDVRQPVTLAAQGVTDTVLASIPLSETRCSSTAAPCACGG
ncbi:MAG: hypothetical protein U1E59_21985 [Amaricoccus sp.]